MSNFTTELTLDQLDDFIFRADFYADDLDGLKKETFLHYNKACHKSETMTSKIVGQLMAMWANKNAEMYSTTKTQLRKIAFTYTKNVSFKLPLEIHRASLILTFPLIQEICAILPKFNDNLFTPSMVCDELRGNYGSDVTVEQAVPKVLKAMATLGMLKRKKRGLYQNNIWPVFNAFGVLATLTAAQAMANKEDPDNNLILKGIGLELSHEFVNCFSELDYESIVGKELWQAFINSSCDYKLQFDGAHWKLSDEEFIYPCFGTPLAKIPPSVKLSTTEAVNFIGEMQK